MINNSATSTQGLNTAIDMCINNKLNNSKFCTFGQVTRVDTDRKIVDVQPIVAEPVNTVDGKIKYEVLPQILNVPYFQSNTPNVNDYCILIHLDKGVWRTMSAAQKTDSDFLRNADGSFTNIVKAKNSTHTLSDCVAICGFTNLNEL